LPSNWVSAETGRGYERYEIKQGHPEYEAVLDNMRKHNGENYVPLVYKVGRVRIKDDHISNCNLQHILNYLIEL